MTEHISATEHDINNRKENYQSPWTPLQAPNLMNFGLETAENGWRVFCQIPYIFALGDTASLTAWTLYNRQQANFDTSYVVARAYSLEQQNAGLAHTWLCHASSFSLLNWVRLAKTEPLAIIIQQVFTGWVLLVSITKLTTKYYNIRRLYTIIRYTDLLMLTRTRTRIPDANH